MEIIKHIALHTVSIVLAIFIVAFLIPVVQKYTGTGQGCSCNGAQQAPQAAGGTAIVDYGAQQFIFTAGPY